MRIWSIPIRLTTIRAVTTLVVLASVIAPVRPLLAANVAKETEFASLLTVQHAGEIYIDLNRNGIREPNEEGIADIAVCIETLEGDLIHETTSDKEGFYLFDDLPEGMLRVRVTPSAGYTILANGEYVISTYNPQSPTVRSTGIFLGLFLPIVRM